MAKDCGNHEDYKRRLLYRRLFAAFLVLLILALFVIFIVWLVLRPTKPKFYLQDASLLQFNLTPGDGAVLTTVLQVTVSSRNTNHRIGVYYDRLDAYLFYNSQRISDVTALPTGYQDHNDFIVWSPFLSGVAVPITPNLVEAVSQDQNAGHLLLSLRLDGRVRWKVGTWISNRYHLQVNCPAYLTVDDGGAFQFDQISACTVDV
ncbi:hypothetical protein Cni_G05170 [Canna indica]|uniref:Late embryogenesis abundant protein LEA-2 subgroup domain-containing protein n=1 Tax=Canna indica TaxID=4628 RepID=A0AAQ3JW25_9LILI|nr:hypothetical protein Cni_G05170 [Canna indica]